MIAWLLACRCGSAPVAVVREEGTRVVIEPERTTLQAPRIELVRGSDRVLLVGTVHVADAAYYEQVNERVAACADVLVEGIAPDDEVAPVDDTLGPALASRGLALQGDALRPAPTWRAVDPTARELRDRLVAAGADAGDVGVLLEDRGQVSLGELLAGLPATPRGDALARFTVLRGMALPDPVHGPDANLYWDVVIGERDERAVEALGEGSSCVIYGADHVADLVARLERRGWTAGEPSWWAAITVEHAALGLGPTQVRQRLQP
ncbi:MAG: hypothetical protein H6735_12180 [Alphaproteobacteria bacterium]|nr:hypothetical protein [Alphaproteobacteria bacterium]